MWYVTHRPRTVEELVFPDDRIASAVRRWLEDGNLPHLLITGPPGTGKTTAAEILARTVAPEDTRRLFLNASMETGIDTMRERVLAFASRSGISGLRIVVLDEADHLSRPAQASLRSLMDRTAAWCRFLLTANWESRIIEPLRSRAVRLVFDRLPPERLVALGRRVLERERIRYDERVLVAHAERSGGDARRFLEGLESSSKNGELGSPPKERIPFAELLGDVVEGDFVLATERIRSEYDEATIRDFYRFCADVLPRILSGADLLKALVHLRDAVVDHETTAFPDVVCVGFLAAIRLIVDEGSSPGRRRSGKRP